MIFGSGCDKVLAGVGVGRSLRELGYDWVQRELAREGYLQTYQWASGPQKSSQTPGPFHTLTPYHHRSAPCYPAPSARPGHDEKWGRGGWDDSVGFSLILGKITQSSCPLSESHPPSLWLILPRESEAGDNLNPDTCLPRLVSNSTLHYPRGETNTGVC